MTRILLENERIRISAQPRLVVADFDEDQAVTSWAIVGGGRRTARSVVWHEIRNADLGLDVDPIRVLEARLAELGRPDAVGMLTSRDLAHVHVRECRFEDLVATAVVTAGLSNALAIGDTPGPIALPGTINVLCHVSAPLSEAASLEALSLVVEARTAATIAHDVPSRRSGLRATGTGTDCVVVASPSRHAGLPYAGKHTAVGHVVGRAVLEATHEAIARWKETFAP
ncbi:MAG: adenosylcobinamide amidohydrolase [Polyangiales bacterium]